MAAICQKALGSAVLTAARLIVREFESKGEKHRDHPRLHAL